VLQETRQQRLNMKLHSILQTKDIASSRAVHRAIQSRRNVNKTSSHRYERRKVRAELQDRGTLDE